MSNPKTLDLTTRNARFSSRYRPRRAGGVAAVERRKPPIALLFDPLAATAGLSSCHYRRRVADDLVASQTAAAIALASSLPPPSLPPPSLPPPDFWAVPEAVARLDGATPALRHRVSEAMDAAERERLPRFIGWLLAAGLSIVLWVGLVGAGFVLSELVSSII
jgi:hypothetical protein